MTPLKDRTGRQLSTSEATAKIFSRLISYFLDFELLLLTWVGLIPCHFTRRFFYRLAGVKIGKGSAIHIGCRFYQPKNVKIGQGTIIGDNAFLDGRAPLIIGNHTDIASQVLIYNSEHDIESEDFNVREESVEIGDYVFIGPRVTIQSGVKIGDGAIIAAGAVVVKNVEPFTVVGGVPAKFIKKRNLVNPHYHLGHARWFQ